MKASADLFLLIGLTLIVAGAAVWMGLAAGLIAGGISFVILALIIAQSKA